MQYLRQNIVGQKVFLDIYNNVMDKNSKAKPLNLISAFTYRGCVVKYTNINMSQIHMLDTYF